MSATQRRIADVHAGRDTGRVSCYLAWTSTAARMGDRQRAHGSGDPTARMLETARNVARNVVRRAARDRRAAEQPPAGLERAA